MRSDENVRAWFEGAPAEVGGTARRLMAEVAAMRESETIYPAQDDIMAALAITAPADARAVIVGQDPYHEPGQAMGLAFSVPAGERLPPSLRDVYQELAGDLGCPAPTSGDLTPWAEQGVLLLNTTLTVRAHAAASHAKLGWQQVTSYVVRRCFELPQPIVFLAWGRHAVGLIEDARAQAQVASLPTKHLLASTHPSPLSARRASGGLPAFIGSRPFSRANALLREDGAQPIDWARVG